MLIINSKIYNMVKKETQYTDPVRVREVLKNVFNMILDDATPQEASVTYVAHLDSANPRDMAELQRLAHSDEGIEAIQRRIFGYIDKCNLPGDDASYLFNECVAELHRKYSEVLRAAEKARKRLEAIRNDKEGYNSSTEMVVRDLDSAVDRGDRDATLPVDQYMRRSMRRAR